MADSVKQGAGLRNVVAGESSISSIDGERGVLAYRGIDIHALGEQSTFEEVAFLLHRGQLPTRAELAAFTQELAHARAVPPPTVSLLKLFPASTHPMTSLRSVVSAMGAFDPDGGDDSPPANARKALRLTAQMATLVALVERVRKGRDPEAERAMDVALILHADHEFNASTFAARVAASTLADVHGAMTAALATLKGPLHGGANEAVMKMLEEIGRPERAEGWIRAALDAKKKIMGFGHAVYRTEDPRATHLRRMSRQLGEVQGDGRWYELSERIEALVRAQKGLNANVDFYSASVYHSLGIPTDLFTPVFAVSRVAGWTAHVLEQLGNNRLIRPESEYTGPRDVAYVPMDQR